MSDAVSPPIHQQPSKRIAIIGECMVELYGRAPHLVQGFAGDTLNTAIYLARLTADQGVQVHYVSAVGTDPFSKAMLDLWQQEHIDCRYVAHIPERNPGLYVISVDEQGERSFHYWRGESAAKLMFENLQAEAHLAALAQCDWVYLSGISIAILPESSRVKLLSALKVARANGAKVAFDNNYRPRLWPSKEVACAVYDQIYQVCDLACLTLDDELAMRPDETVDQMVRRCQASGISELVVKCGAAPCLVVHGDSQVEVAANSVAAVVDTTAAGDSFSAAYLAARMHNLPPEQAASWGHRLAGRVIQFPGAIIAQDKMPSFQQQ